MNSLLFIASNIGNKNSAPFTRSNEFSKVFQEKGFVLRGKAKLKKALSLPALDFLYMETAPHRITFGDFWALLLLRTKTKFIVIYIRDVYCEFFKEEYKGIRRKISLVANRISYFLFALISDYLVFPSIEMGNYFYLKNKFPVRKYTNLPPGVPIPEKNRKNPDFNKKTGVLYLGNPNYTNSGFDFFLKFAKICNDKFNFYILTADKESFKDKPYITADFIDHKEIVTFLESNNVAFAIHTRPRNGYDDITIPIKAMDFISLNLPFITDEHKPLKQILGDNYPFYCEMDEKKVFELINQYNSLEKYKVLYNYIENILIENTYYKRYEKLTKLYKEGTAYFQQERF